MTLQTESTTRTLAVPGALLTYDVRRNDETTEPILLLIGSPMGAAGFGTLAGHFEDRTVVTYDPRAWSAAPRPIRGAPRRPRSTPMTCIGSFESSAAPSTSSPAAGAP